MPDTVTDTEPDVGMFVNPMEEIRPMLKDTVAFPVEEAPRAVAVTATFSDILLETLQARDESETHLENWQAVLARRALDESDVTAEKREPITDKGVLPDDGELTTTTEPTFKISKENKLELLDD